MRFYKLAVDLHRDQCNDHAKEQAASCGIILAQHIGNGDLNIIYGGHNVSRQDGNKRTHSHNAGVRAIAQAVLLGKLHTDQEYGSHRKEVQRRIVGSVEQIGEHSKPGHTGQLRQADAGGSGRAHNIGDQCAERAGQNNRHQGVECILDGCHVLLVADLSSDHKQLLTGVVSEFAHVFSPLS